MKSVSSTSQPSVSIPPEIDQLVLECGEKLVAEHLGTATPPEDLAESWEVLDGYCHGNAYCLANELLNAGYTPYLVWGGVAPSDDTPFTMETIDQLEQSGRTHFWVELSPDSVGEKKDTRIIAELSSEADGYTNEPLVQTELPDQYHRMSSDPSYIRFERSYESLDLISKESYNRLRARSPELFSHSPWEDR